MNPEDWDKRYAGSALLWTAEPNRFLAAEAANLPPGRALDLACGEGRNSVWLAERGWDVTAVDFSAVGLDKAAGLAGERGVAVEWVRADVLDYLPAPSAFDLVAVLYLHVPASERRRALAGAAAALSIGGTLLVVGHDSTNPAEGCGGPQDPSILFSAADVAADLPGLSIERAERVLRPVRSSHGEANAIDALVRATRNPDTTSTTRGS